VLPTLEPIEEEHSLDPGDILVLYTDGYALPGLDPPDSIELALAKCTRDTPEDLLDHMLGILFGDAPDVRDDVALFAIRISDRES
jgi:hypothetical protein